MSSLFGDRYSERRRANANALKAFGLAGESERDSIYRDIRVGSGPTVFTIGYERRDSEDLVSRLLDAGVDILVDVRERPFSRKPDFRRGPLERACANAGIEYESWSSLGSTGHQREILRSSGDFGLFRKRFRELVRRSRMDDIEELAELAEVKSIALICYERCHEECHRSIVAEFVSEVCDASIVAIG